MTSTGLGWTVPMHDPRWEAGCRVEPCVCGGTLVAYLGDDIREVVSAHNSSAIHRQWRESRGQGTSVEYADAATIGA